MPSPINNVNNARLFFEHGIEKLLGNNQAVIDFIDADFFQRHSFATIKGNIDIHQAGKERPGQHGVRNIAFMEFFDCFKPLVVFLGDSVFADQKLIGSAWHFAAGAVVRIQLINSFPVFLFAAIKDQFFGDVAGRF